MKKLELFDIFKYRVENNTNLGLVKVGDILFSMFQIWRFGAAWG